MRYRKVWELHNGPIPKDTNGRSYEIHHLDLDRTNNSIENLQCVSLQEHYEIHLKRGDYASAAFLKQKMGTPLSGWKHSEATKKKIALGRGMTGKKHSAETKRKMSETRLGIIVSEETKQKQRESKLNKPTKYWQGKSRKGMIVNHPTLTCTYCGKIGKGESAMNKWHFEKCKLK
jgi:hypothetical protein